MNRWGFLKRKEEKFKNKARIALQRAVKKGIICREPCHFCGEDRVEAHHEDYSLPLDVVWLCKRHHAARHSYLKWTTPSNIEISIILMRNGKRIGYYEPAPVKDRLKRYYDPYPIQIEMFPNNDLQDWLSLIRSQINDNTRSRRQIHGLFCKEN